VAFTTASIVAAHGEAGNALLTRTPAAVTITGAIGDTTPPTRSAGSPSGALAYATTQTTLALATNEAATCKYGTAAGTAYASIANTFSTTGSTSHSATLSGLTNGGSYSYYVRCVDGSANANTTDYTISFSVAATAPVVNQDDDDDDDSDDEEEVKPRKLTNSKKNLKRGEILTQRGKKFTKKSMVALYFSKANGTYYAPMMVKTTNTGSFMVKYRVNKPAGKYSWYAVDSKTGKKSKVITYMVK
jgi:Ni/Co efflux regulator RcnB